MKVARSCQVDSGFKEELNVPLVLRNAAKMDLGVYAANAKTTDFLDLNGVAYCCCILYRLWIKKGPNMNNPKVSVFEFQFQPLPESIVIDEKVSKKIKCPYETEDWFPILVQHVHRILKRSRIGLPVLMVALLYIGRLRSLIITPVIKPVEHITQILISAIMVTQKVHSDMKFSISDWSRITSYAPEQLLTFERYFLFYYTKLYCRFSISPHQFSAWLGIAESLQMEYEYVFRSYDLSLDEFNAYIAKSRRHRPEIVEDMIGVRLMQQSLKNH